jgi:hypothetical protein
MLLDRVGHLPVSDSFYATNFVRRLSKFKSQFAYVDRTNNTVFSGC